MGPLRVQKALYPETPAVCHAIIVHPPGGVVGGDQLRVEVDVGASAAALLTTPGAAKWYRANGRPSGQTIHLSVAAGGALEWLPQEAIFYDGAQVDLRSTIELHGDARYIGCDMLCFGRTASGERFTHGAIRQRSTIRRDGTLIWFEQGALSGTGAMMQSPLGLGGKTVCATLLASGGALSATELTDLRQALGNEVGVSQLKTLLVVRYLGDSSQIAREKMMCAWQQLRPLLMGRHGVVPRSWNT